MSVVRSGPAGAPLRLDGEDIKLLSVTVDGKPASHKLDRSGLAVRVASDTAMVETLVEIVPGNEQRGLFKIGGLLATQCEPQGFRRITFFPDRPDLLARFRTRIVADASA